MSYDDGLDSSRWARGVRLGSSNREKNYLGGSYSGADYNGAGATNSNEVVVVQRFISLRSMETEYVTGGHM